MVAANSWSHLDAGRHAPPRDLVFPAALEGRPEVAALYRGAHESSPSERRSHLGVQSHSRSNFNSTSRFGPLDRICYRCNASRLEWSSSHHGIHLLLALVPDLEEAVPGPCCHSHAIISYPQAADTVVMAS